MNRFFPQSTLVLLAVLLTACQTTPRIDEEVGASVAEAASMKDIEYSIAPFLELVGKYVTADGKVDYAAWKASPEDMAALDRQVEMLARISPKSHPEHFPGRAAERSYWINTYNTLVLQAVLAYWPLESVREVRVSFTSRVVPGKGFFYDREIVVGGEVTNLYKLEKEVLASQKDPRIHFALNCASSSCPVLRPWEWTDEQLDQAARDFVNNPANLEVEDGQVRMSRIFKWYKSDFPEDTYAYLQQYADEPLREQLQSARDHDWPRRYVEYDWRLNDAAGGEATAHAGSH